MRDTYNQLVESLKETYNVTKAYSYSQIKSFEDDSYEYMLKYVDKVDPDIKEVSLYAIIGSLIHDILEAYFNGELSKEECLEKFSTKFEEEVKSINNRPFSTIPNVNSSIITKYRSDLTDYLKRLPEEFDKVSCETPVTTFYENALSRAAFIGYIDFMSEKDNKLTIIDYKTAKVYTDSDLILNARQLLLYADAMRTSRNLDYSDITVAWNFLRFAKLINKNDLSEEIVERSCLTGLDLSNYLILDCIIYVDFNEDTVAAMKNNLLANVLAIESSTKEYIETGDDSVFSYTVTQNDLFRLNNFCSYSSKYHRPLREYLNKSLDTLLLKW